jgi:hypothetical protein
VTCAVEASGWVADGINPQFEVAANLGVTVEFAEEVHDAEDSGRLIAMDACKDTEFDAIFNDACSLEPEAGDPEEVFSVAPFEESVGGEAFGIVGLNGEWQQQLAKIKTVSFLES